MRHDLAVTKVALTDGEESLRLMREVQWLRARLGERDDDIRRAAETNISLVERFSSAEQSRFESR